MCPMGAPENMCPRGQGAAHRCESQRVDLGQEEASQGSGGPQQHQDLRGGWGGRCVWGGGGKEGGYPM